MDFWRPRDSLRAMTAHTPEETHALLEAALNAGDAHAFAAVFEEDATMIDPQDGVLVHGRDAIRRSVEPVMAAKPAAEIEVVAKLEVDGLALTHARWQAGEMSGYGTIVSRRQPDGSWLIALDNPLSGVVITRNDPHERHFLA
jgi:uncharacterized protein (TIGR02246 family)